MKRIVCVILAVLLIAAGAAVIVFTDAPVISETVTISGGKAEPAMSTYQFDVDSDGGYVFEIEWELEKPGILTGVNVVDEDGESVFAATADWAQMESTLSELESGTYTLETHYLASEDDVDAFLERTGLEPFEPDYDFASEGTWKMKYNFYAIAEGEESPFYIAGVVVGVLFGLVFVLLIIAFAKTNNGEKARFDERQEVVRGRGFKYGFFTTLVAGGAMIILDLLDVSLFAELSVAMMVSLLCGIAVFASYCIWNDGYFALNERRRSLMTVFGIVGAMNIAIGVMNALSDELMVGGTLTVQCVNLACGVMFIVIFAVMLAKKIKDGRED